MSVEEVPGEMPTDEPPQEDTTTKEEPNGNEPEPESPSEPTPAQKPAETTEPKCKSAGDSCDNDDACCGEQTCQSGKCGGGEEGRIEEFIDNLVGYKDRINFNPPKIEW